MKRTNNFADVFSPNKRNNTSSTTATAMATNNNTIANSSITNSSITNQSTPQKKLTKTKPIHTPESSSTNAYQSKSARGSGYTNNSGVISPWVKRAPLYLHPKTEKISVFNDPIHGNITMGGICLRIIDTHEFQRLRDLKQLGTCDYVYSGATHTRFVHSIGVAYYAEKFVQTLQQNQPMLQITDKDILCVKIAGLCHDLGHGPFSHVFDGVFMTRMHPDGKKSRHEDWSINIFNYLLQKNNIVLEDYGLTSQDKLFIEEIIRGTDEKDRQGRSYDKFYLYDIVNNGRSGLDVDKLDYFQRDIRYTNVNTNYNNFQRLLEFGRVLHAEPIVPKQHQHRVLINHHHLLTSSSSQQSLSLLYNNSEQSLLNNPFDSPLNDGNIDLPEHYMICYPEKMIGEILQLFTLRYQLHQKVYTHKSVKKVEYMVRIINKYCLICCLIIVCLIFLVGRCFGKS